MQLQCPSCSHVNRDSARFCEDCGRRLGRVCGGCGAELGEAAKFCDSCGEQAPGAGSGRRIPLRVFELKGGGQASTRLDVSRSRGFSRIVGRGAETSLIEAAFERASAGDGNAVALIGEAGVGKSRLCHEFVERCRARGARVLAAQGLPHGKSLPLRPVLQLLRALFGIGERDDPETARHKIAGTLLLLDEAFKPALPLVFDFLGVPDTASPTSELEPESRQHLLLHIVKGLIQARSRDQALVVLLEDLHWFDSGSEAFLPHLAAALPESRALLLVNFRPEHEATWMKGSYHQQVPLRPLDAEVSRELLADLLGSDARMATLGDEIHIHTGGNPFFIEETGC